MRDFLIFIRFYFFCTVNYRIGVNADWSYHAQYSGHVFLTDQSHMGALQRATMYLARMFVSKSKTSLKGKYS